MDFMDSVVNGFKHLENSAQNLILSYFGPLAIISFICFGILLCQIRSK